MSRFLAAFTRPLLADNPVSVQFLGICSALAVTKTVGTALAMGAAVTAVIVLSSGIISLLRRSIPRSTRLIVLTTIIATLVIATDQFLAAFAPEVSRELSIFVSLIITNCIILGRAEAFATTHGVLESVADGLGNGLGYALLLIAVGSIRELLGEGSLNGWQLLTLSQDGGWFEPLRIFELPPGAFFLIALFIGLSTAARRLTPRGAEAP